MNIRKLSLFSRNNRGFKRAATLVIFLAGMQAPITHAMPILDLDSDFQIHGAKGVLIDGFSYNVRFLDSSCDVIWSGCDRNKFLFKTAEVAEKASAALLDQVLLDFANHLLFDGVPWATTGCALTRSCNVLTPYALVTRGPDVYVRSRAAYNSFFEGKDNTANTHDGFRDDEDFARFPGFVYARWAVPSAPVPEPSAMLLMASGLIAFAAVRRKAA